MVVDYFFFFFQAEDGIRDVAVTGVQTCALPISPGQRRPAGASFFLPRTGCGVRSITRGKNGDDMKRTGKMLAVMLVLAATVAVVKAQDQKPTQPAAPPAATAPAPKPDPRGTVTGAI